MRITASNFCSTFRYYNTDTKGYLQKGNGEESETEYEARARAACNVIRNSKKQFVVVFAHGSLNIEVFKAFAKECKDKGPKQPALEPHIRINPKKTERAMPTGNIPTDEFFERIDLSNDYILQEGEWCMEMGW